MATKKEGTKKASKKAVPVVSAEILAPKTANETDAVDVLHLRLGIDQVGLDINGALSEKLFFELKIGKRGDEPVNLRKVAGQFANIIWGGVQALKGRNRGFNVTFLIDNTTIANVSMKSAGKIHFNSPDAIAFGLWPLLAAQFDMENSEGLLTGEIQNSEEISLVSRQLGIEGANLPFSYMRPLFEYQRKDVHQRFVSAQKDAIQKRYPALMAKKLAADAARVNAKKTRTQVEPAEIVVVEGQEN